MCFLAKTKGKKSTHSSRAGKMATDAHKAGPLKQQNKAHKHGRHKTKGQVDKTNKGKESLTLCIVQMLTDLNLFLD